MSRKFTYLTDKKGNKMKVPVRGAQHYLDKGARYTGYKPEKLLLKKGSIRLKGYMPLPCDILFERDVPITLRDGVIIYTDVFRPADDGRHPAIIAMSPYGKEIGSQWLDDTPNHAGIPIEATSGLQKFEGPDPAYWVDHGYAVVNPDVRGAYKSEGVILFFGSDYGRDGKDIVEWTAAQEWSNQKVGMSGNSWLAISQWFTAAQRPEHLAAIAPWEGLNNCYDEVAARGGVPMPAFVKMLSDSFASTGDGGVEDVIQCMRDSLVWNDYWEDKKADLENIECPAYIAASYNNPIHTYGSIEGYRRIASEDKWLRIHNTGEWDDYYNKEHTEDLRRFFDHYLIGVDNGWEKTPHIRMSVLNPGGRDIVDRIESSFPPESVRYTKFYLDAENHSLSTTAPKRAAFLEYNSSKRKVSEVFDFTMPEDTEISGYIKLRLWVSAEDSDDLDLAVKMEKLNAKGRPYVKSAGPGVDFSAKGYIRASMRELDPETSTEANPHQSYRRVRKLKPGEIVPLDILIWPMAMLWKKGDILRLTVAPYKTKKLWTGPFKLKMAKIRIPKEGYTWFPDNEPEMETIGGGKMFAGSHVDTAELPRDINEGRHRIYTGGIHQSYLYLPVNKKSK